MRGAFIEALCTVAARSDRVWLVCGDLGFSVLEAFRQQFPNRFLNAGVAEQNMMGVAAGLAHAGKTVFVYSIANFPVVRCLEQIRNDVCYHKLDVKIVAVGGGLAYGSAGYSHHATEDLGILRTLPNISVVAPGDPVETRLTVEAMVAKPGPAYLRLGKAGEEVVHKKPPELVLGRATELVAGDDVTLISTGGILPEAVRAHALLKERGFAARVLSMHTIRPIDVEAIVAAARQTRAILTIEEHGRGGLGAAVAEVLSAMPSGVPFRALRLPDDLHENVVSQMGARRLYGLDAAAIAAVACEMLAT
jgi:transketolase